jgi:hypothetical protein
MITRLEKLIASIVDNGLIWRHTMNASISTKDMVGKLSSSESVPPNDLELSNEPSSSGLN